MVTNEEYIKPLISINVIGDFIQYQEQFRAMLEIGL